MTRTRPVVGLPTLTWLRAFEAAARTASFTAAATELNLTSGAISYQIRALEAHLGFALFERLPRGVKLTPMGVAYLPPVRKAFEELADSTMGLFGSSERSRSRSCARIAGRFVACAQTACIRPRKSFDRCTLIVRDLGQRRPRRGHGSGNPLRRRPMAWVPLGALDEPQHLGGVRPALLRGMRRTATSPPCCPCIRFTSWAMRTIG